MESTMQKPALLAAGSTSRTTAIIYWIATGLFCLQMSFTAYAQLRMPLALGAPPQEWLWAAATGVLWALSYLCWRRLPAKPAQLK